MPGMGANGQKLTTRSAPRSSATAQLPPWVTGYLPECVSATAGDRIHGYSAPDSCRLALAPNSSLEPIETHAPLLCCADHPIKGASELRPVVRTASDQPMLPGMKQRTFV